MRRDRDHGWGVLEFSEIHSAAGHEWTDDGQVHEVLFAAATWQNACWRPRWGAYGGCAVGGWFGAEVPWCFRVTASMVPAVGRLAGAY
jgi:hypothetical protein